MGHSMPPRGLVQSVYVPGERPGLWRFDVYVDQHAGAASPCPCPRRVEQTLASAAAAVREAVLDLHLDDEEFNRLQARQKRHKLTLDQVRAVHAAILAEDLMSYVSDGLLTANEEEHIELLMGCLDKLGWKPG